jgi:hypothetical protein
MKLSAPKKNTWWICLILTAVAVVGQIVAIPFVTAYSFWILAVGAVLLILATCIKNL